MSTTTKQEQSVVEGAGRRRRRGKTEARDEGVVDVKEAHNNNANKEPY